MLVWPALFLFLTAGGLAAQSSKAPLRDPNLRNLSGKVFRPDKTPAIGAIVKLKNTKTLQILSYITQEGGRYQFNSLSTGIDYEVYAEFEDMISKRRGLSVFDQRANAVLDLKLAPMKKGKNAANATKGN